MPSWVSVRTKQLRTERDVAKRKYLLSKSKQSREIWRKLNSSLNESYKADEMARLNKQMEELQLADSKGDYSTTWKIIHDLSGKDRNPKVKVKMRDGAPPKSDKDLLAEWQEYFSSLLNNDNGQAPSDLPQPASQDLPIHDHPPTLEETLEAIRQMKTNKAAGLDCYYRRSSPGWRWCNGRCYPCFCAEVYSNLTLPDQWITSVIVPSPKKGDLSLMTNYRGISLLSIATKVYNKILLNRIRDEVDPILRKNQAGFRPGRSCAQQIHILRRVLEGFRDYQLPRVVTFIDFKKAFDSTNRKVMFAVLRHYGIPEAVVNQCGLQKLKNSKSAVMVDGGLSDPFDVTTGVLQGDVLAPFLFVVLVDYLLKKATSQLDSGVVTHPRRFTRHPAKSLNDLDFAGDIALLESSISRAQAQLTKTAEAAADLGLVISAPKTEYMTVNCNPQPALQVYGDPINHVSDFRYLGSMVASGSSDLKRRRSLAWCAFWKLEQLWKSPHIPITKKVKLFNTTCVTILLYGCESWMMSQDMENKINAFATSCYRVMLNIKRIDHVLNTTVYSMTNTVPLIHLVRHRQLKFLGHILRMSKEEPARRYALYIPTTGRRRPGRPRTSYLNSVQRLLGDNEGATQE